MWLVLRKKNILWRTLAKIVEKIKVTKLKYVINPLQRKHARRKLVFTVAVLLKGNRSSFSKQLGINCTCEQIGLFLISTRGCGSHSWKLLKSPICSRVQLIPNCFSNRSISYTNCTMTFNLSSTARPCLSLNLANDDCISSKVIRIPTDADSSLHFLGVL